MEYFVIAMIAWLVCAASEGTMAAIFTMLCLLYETPRPMQLKVMSAGLWVLFAHFLFMAVRAWGLAGDGDAHPSWMAGGSIIFAAAFTGINAAWSWTLLKMDETSNVTIIRRKR